MSKTETISFSSVPSGWHEIPWSKGFQIITKSESLNDLELLSLLTDIPVKEIRKSPDVHKVYPFISALTYLQDLPVQKYPEMPRYVLRPGTDDDKIPLPWINYFDKFDMGGCTVGQVEDMKQVWIDTNPKDELDVFELYGKFCAIYLQPILNPMPRTPGDESEYTPYDYQIAMMYEKEIDKLDSKFVLNMGGFFLQRLIDWHDGLKNEWQRRLTLRQRLRLVLLGWLQRLVSMLP